MGYVGMRNQHIHCDFKRRNKFMFQKFDKNFNEELGPLK
jgi:hypothetical protein